MENIKKRLREYKFIKAEITELKLKLQELNEEIGVSGMSYGERSSQTYKITSSTEDAAIRIAEVSEKYNKIIKEKGIEVTRIENALSILKEKERQCIEYRYIYEHELPTVCYKVDRSMTTVKKYISDGLKKMDKLING